MYLDLLDKWVGLNQKAYLLGRERGETDTRERFYDLLDRMLNSDTLWMHPKQTEIILCFLVEDQPEYHKHLRGLLLPDYKKDSEAIK